METIKTVEDEKYIYYSNGDIYNKKMKKNITSWNRDGYKQVYLFGEFKSLHRILYEKFIGEIPVGMIIDHRNNVRNDNRLSNLQVLSVKDNTRKSLIRSDNTSGYKGVVWDKQQAGWRVYIRDNDGKNISKRFKEIKDAIEFRKHKELEFGYLQVETN
jgi:hypothetical protein